MKMSFSTLACPTWTLGQAVDIAVRSGYDAIELRFLEGEDSLWKLPTLQGTALKSSARMINERGLSVACVDTSCRFHSPDATERKHWIDEGIRMAELAKTFAAPGIRVFGDKIQPGADRTSTRAWIADGVRELAAKTEKDDVQVWLETHGDFASSQETIAIIQKSTRHDIGVVWDPANAFTDGNENPPAAAQNFGSALRHVHLRDLNRVNGGWKPVLTGEGKFALHEIIAELERLKYDYFVSFEWEKKWQPDLADPEVAVPHFAKWFRQNSNRQ
jgi:sugar phosphate isomerase/epimerase